MKTADEKAWLTNMDNPDNAGFIEKCTNLYGDDLDRFIKSQFTESNTEENNVKLTGNGSWMDEEDIREKYEKKPQRLAAILKNAARWTCPDGEVELIQDMSYKTAYEHNQLNKLKHERSMETKEILKKAKEPKVVTSVETVKKEEDAREKQNEPKPFTPPQLATLTKGKASIEKAVEDLIKSRDEANTKDLMADMPKYMTPNVEQTLAAASVLVSELEVLLEALKGPYKPMCTRIVDSKKELIETRKRLQMFMGDAVSHK